MILRGLAVTVGTSPEPVRKAVEVEKPAFVLFIVSSTTWNVPAEKVLPTLKYVPQWQLLEVSDPERIETCYREISEGLQRWLKERRIGCPEVYIDLTGGTKVMSAALALVATDESIGSFTYVGGDARDPDNRGIVVTGFERVVSTGNPIQTYAVRELERANWLLAEFYADAAVEVLQYAAGRCDAAFQKPLETFAGLAKSLGCADRFDFDGALDNYGGWRRNLALMDYSICKEVESLDQQWKTISEQVKSGDRTPGRETLLELLANAERRAHQSRYDDAVGRLYRAVELGGQQLVQQAFGAELGKVDLENFPENRRQEVISTLGEPQDGTYKLGVQNLFRALSFSENEAFCNKTATYYALKGPLQKRNSSLLAHGAQPVKKVDFELFWEKALTSFNILDSEISRWPPLKLELPRSVASGG